MYNFNLMDDEKIVEIFDDVWIRQGENEKVTTIALTDKRLLFLDYLILDEGREVLRIAKGVNYIKYKDVYYQINLSNIESIDKKEYYFVTLKDKTVFEFDDINLYKLLTK